MAAPMRPRPQNPICMAMSPVGCAPCLMASRATVKRRRKKRWPRSGGGNLARYPQVTGELHALGVLQHDFDRAQQRIEPPLRGRVRRTLYLGGDRIRLGLDRAAEPRAALARFVGEAVTWPILDDHAEELRGRERRL